MTQGDSVFYKFIRIKPYTIDCIGQIREKQHNLKKIKIK